MDLPQANLPHRTTDWTAGRVARRTEVAAPPNPNSNLRTLLRSAKTLNRASLQRKDRPEKMMKYAEYNGNRLNREYGVRKSSRTSD